MKVLVMDRTLESEFLKQMEAVSEVLDIVTPAQIIEALRLVRGNVSKAAKYLKMSRNTR